MNWGSACSALKKTWHAFKLGKKRGEYVTDLAIRVNRLQDGMGIPPTEFEGLEHYEDGEGSDEESDEEWSSESESEKALHRQLRKEEQDDARGENNDW